jgi:UDP-N-acetylmuramate--alanine ligase
MNIPKHIYMLGIGGIGMSALARHFIQAGRKVAGYDRNASDITESLQQSGVEIHFIDDPSWVPDEFKPTNTLVIITPAIPQNCRELKYLQEKNFTIVKRSEVLGMLATDKTLVAVAGTHGKTSTSAMTAWLLHHNNKKCHAFIGGVMTNLNSNYVDGGKSDIMVAEADEFDRSFLTFRPHVAIVTSTDADHLDIYQTRDHMVRAFGQFVQQIKAGGTLLYRYGIKLEKPEHVRCISYGHEAECDLRYTNLRIVNGAFVFDLTGFLNIADITLHFPGRHNLENAMAAMAAAHIMGMKEEHLREHIATFKGIKRRFEFIVRNEHHVYIDDYAHHPAEIAACVSAVRDLYPDKYIMGIFQPHLYTRTRDFAMEFADSLNLLDEPVLIPLYPAREEPIPGVNSELILQKLKGEHRSVMARDEVVAYVQRKKPDVLLTLGAGDIDQMVDSLALVFQQEIAE